MEKIGRSYTKELQGKIYLAYFKSIFILATFEQGIIAKSTSIMRLKFISLVRNVLNVDMNKITRNRCNLSRDVSVF